MILDALLSLLQFLWLGFVRYQVLLVIFPLQRPVMFPWDVKNNHLLAKDLALM